MMKVFNIIIFLILIANVFAEWGCDFDENYQTKQKPEWPKSIYGNTKIAYNSTMMIFEQEDDFNQFLTAITSAIEDVMEKHVLNNVDSYLDYYDQYLEKFKLPNKNIAFSKFKTEIFTPYFIPHASSAALVLDVYETLKNFRDDFSQCAYLISCHPRAHPGIIYIQQKYPNSRPGELLFQPQHVSGIVRVKIMGRPGFVIVEPGFGFLRPMVLMDDGETYNGSEVFEKESRKFTSSFLPSSRIFIQTSVEHAEYETYYNLYYIGEPYCSFVDTTTRVDVAQPVRRMIKRFKNGDVKAKIDFPVDQAFRCCSNVAYNVMLRREDEFDTDTIRFIDLNHIRNPPNEDWTNKANYLKEVAAALEIEYEELLNKIERIYNILRDDAFITRLDSKRALSLPEKIGKFVANFCKDGFDDGVYRL